jgi:hypothetical protein
MYIEFKEFKINDPHLQSLTNFLINSASNIILSTSRCLIEPQVVETTVRTVH